MIGTETQDWHQQEYCKLLSALNAIRGPLGLRIGEKIPGGNKDLTDEWERILVIRQSELMKCKDCSKIDRS